MTLVLAALAQLVILLLVQQPPAATGAATDEDFLRAAVQEYFDAQAQKDPAKAAGFWSATANPRPTRESFVAMFAAGEDHVSATIQSIALKGEDARVRVEARRLRTVIRSGQTMQMPTFAHIAQRWRKEATAWKLVRDGPPAEDFADDLLAAPPGDRARLMAENRLELTSGLRYVLAQRASALIPSQQFGKAREVFELALAVARATNDRRSESETLQNIANAYYFARDFQNAADVYQQRLSLAREMEDAEATAASILGLATIAYSRAEYTAALTSYREALAIYETRDEGTSIGRTLVSVGNVQYLQAEYDAATASYRRALGLLVAGLDSQGATFARGGLARVFAAQGDLVAALDMYGQVLVDARAQFALDPRSRSNVAAALESIGEVYFRLGNMDLARTNVEAARKMAEAEHESAGRLSSTLGLIELVAGRFDAALAGYTESRTRYEQAKRPAGVAAAWVGIGFSHTAREKFTDAMTAYRTAIRMFEANKLNEESARAWLGLSLAQSGAREYPAALQSAQKVRGIADVVKSEDLAWRGAVRAGEALRKLARVDDAREAFQQAVIAIDRLAADAPINPERRGQLEDSASAWTGLAMALATKGDAPGALAAAEARRAHIRRVQFAGFQRDITKGATPEEIADEQVIVRELISMRAQLRAEHNLRRPDATRLDRLQQQLTTLVSRREEQQLNLYARVPELQEWRGLRPPSAPAYFGALVPDARTLIVEYVVGDEEVLVLSVGRLRQGFNEPGVSEPGNDLDIAATIVPANRRELADRIAHAMQPAALADAAEWRTVAEPIAATLITPIASRLAGRDRCIVIPDDLLWKVPFEALIGDASLGRPTRVTYATSLVTLAVQHRVAAARPPLERASAGIAAAPVIPVGIHTQLTLAQPGWKEPDAAASLASATALAKTYGDTALVRSGAAATEAGTRMLLETVDILHVAAPLQMAGATPLFSSVILGGSVEGVEGPENDGRWEVREWFRVAGRARVVVLPDASSFGTAGIGGSMDALAWAAAAAGVPTLIVGRWPAEAFAPDALMAAFHTHIATGLTPGEAWRLATVAAREKNGAAPSGWSGLRFIGAAS